MNSDLDQESGGSCRPGSQKDIRSDSEAVRDQLMGECKTELGCWATSPNRDRWHSDVPGPRPNNAQTAREGLASGPLK